MIFIWDAWCTWRWLFTCGRLTCTQRNINQPETAYLAMAPAVNKVHESRCYSPQTPSERLKSLDYLTLSLFVRFYIAQQRLAEISPIPSCERCFLIEKPSIQQTEPRNFEDSRSISSIQICIDLPSNAINPALGCTNSKAMDITGSEYLSTFVSTRHLTSAIHEGG